MHPVRPWLRSVAGAITLAALAALFLFLLRRAPPEALASLRRVPARTLVLAGAVYAAGFAFRAARLNLLLPPEERLPFGRALALSGAATFLLQVVPFRGGEVAGWALFRRELDATWGRAGAAFALVKLVDSATLLLAGLAGAAVLAFEGGASALGGTAAAFVALAAGALLAAPSVGERLLRAFEPRLPEGSRRRRVASEIAAGLAVARSSPGLYAGACLFSLAFLGTHLAMLKLLFDGAGLPASVAALALASLASVLSAALLPSPAGSFGPMESGFAAGLAAAGVSPAAGALVAAFAHLFGTAITGLLGLPLLRRRGGPRSPAA